MRVVSSEFKNASKHGVHQESVLWCKQHFIRAKNVAHCIFSVWQKVYRSGAGGRITIPSQAYPGLNHTRALFQNELGMLHVYVSAYARVYHT